MTVEFDTATGHLRLSRESFDPLVTRVGDDALRRAGALIADEPHPSIAASLQAVVDARCRLFLELVDDQGRKHGDGWVADHGAALLFDTADGLCEFVGLPAVLVPAAVARLVGLEPRPQADDAPHHLSSEQYEELIPGHPARIDENSTRLAAALASGRWRRWTATATWSDRNGDPASTGLHVLDTEAGWYLCTASETEAVITPTNATAIWRRLTLLLPDEVGPIDDREVLSG